MIRSEYLRFLKTLTNESVTADVRKVANLVLQHFDDLTPLTTAQGQRVKKMVELAQANWGSISDEIQPTQDQTTEQDIPISQLKSLSVGPFRGFAKQEIFDLSSRLVLIYGPNGTGKSSFCESLEYSLLGNVVEAESKRFSNQHEYIKNAHTNTFDEPVIECVDDEGVEVPVSSNEAIYRFCFVEKNRIDNFSRIAAKTPAKQTELISTLFGLDSFNEFISNFTAEMDYRYIDLEGIKAKILNKKQLTLTGSHQQLKSNKEELKKLEEEKKSLALQYRNGATFDQMVIELNGNEEDPWYYQKVRNRTSKTHR